MLHVGYKNYVSIDKILAITGADTAPLRRQRHHAEDEHKIIDCSNGRKVLSLVHLVDGFMLTSAITPEGLVKRMGDK